MRRRRYVPVVLDRAVREAPSLLVRVASLAVPRDDVLRRRAGRAGRGWCPLLHQRALRARGIVEDLKMTAGAQGKLSRKEGTAPGALPKPG